MSTRRTLVFGSMPAGATPQTHVAAGSWCFAGQEGNFPDWWEYFSLPDDPFSSAIDVEAVAKAANGEVLRLIHVFAKELEAERGVRRSLEFWEMALGPWLLLCVHMLTERQKRLQDLIECYAHEPLRVDILPEDCAFSFRTTLDFMMHGVQNVEFNHYVFSRMLALNAPAQWELAMQPERALHQPSQAGAGLMHLLKDGLRNALRALPFPRQKGFSLGQSLLLSLAVLLNRGKTVDATIDFALYCGAPHSWLFPAEEFIRACMPTDLRAAALPAAGKHKGRLRGMTAAFSQDDRYRLFLGAWREGGGKLFCVQHGANYGNLLSIGGIPTEYRQHAFFSWGWRRHGDIPVNAIPLPHPALTEVYNAHQEKEPSLILVGTEMSTLAYRLKSRPQAKELVEYREDKVRFLRALNADVQPLYRPYFAVAGGLEDAGYVQRRMQELPAQRNTTGAAEPLLNANASQAESVGCTQPQSADCTQAGDIAGKGASCTQLQSAHCGGVTLCTGDLTARMLECRLLVLDHYGTTMHAAFAANVPTLCFWQRQQWGMDDATEQALDVLSAAGIFFPGPKEAAEQASRIWADVPYWWRSDAVQSARRFWMERYALCAVDARGNALSSTQWLQGWFNALRTV